MIKSTEQVDAIEPQVSDARMHNTRGWAFVRIGTLSGAEVIVAACDEAVAYRQLREKLLPAMGLLKRLKEDGRYLLSVAMTREETTAAEPPTYGGKASRRWLTDAEYAALCSIVDCGSAENSTSGGEVPRSGD